MKINSKFRIQRLKGGFTLIEIIVVVAIIGILATVVIMSYGGAVAKSNYTKTEADLTSIYKAVTFYNSQYMDYPDESGGKINNANFSKFLASWPTPPCKNYSYYYKNDYNSDNSVGVYFRYENYSFPVNVYYINIKNLQPCQGLSCPGYGMVASSKRFIVSAIAAPATNNTMNTVAETSSSNLPILINNVNTQAFKCNVYNNFL